MGMGCNQETSRAVIGLVSSIFFIVLITLVLVFWVVPYATQEAAPSADLVLEVQGKDKENCNYTGEFTRDREGSDFAHWGEGEICVADDLVVFTGSLAVGPVYYLYYVTKYVETRQEFNEIKAESVRGNQIKGFKGFIQMVPKKVAEDFEKFPALVV